MTKIKEKVGKVAQQVQFIAGRMKELRKQIVHLTESLIPDPVSEET